MISVHYFKYFFYIFVNIYIVNNYGGWDGAIYIHIIFTTTNLLLYLLSNLYYLQLINLLQKLIKNALSYLISVNVNGYSNIPVQIRVYIFIKIQYETVINLINIVFCNYTSKFESVLILFLYILLNVTLVYYKRFL